MEEAPEFEAMDDQAKRLLSEGRNEQALEIYENAIQTYPNNSVAWSNHGYVLDLLGHLDASLASFHRAVQLDARNAMALANRSRAHRMLGRLEEALADIESAVEIDENAAGPWNSLGVTLEALNRIPEAIAAYDRAVTLDPADQLYADNLARVTPRLPQGTEALDAYDEALRRNPHSATIACARLRVLREAADDREAIQASAAVTLARPRDAAVWVLHGEVCQERGARRDALSAYECALALDPQNERAWAAKAAALEAAGCPRAAAACRERTLAIDFEVAESTIEGGLYDREPPILNTPAVRRFFELIEGRARMNPDDLLTALREVSGSGPDWATVWGAVGHQLIQEGETELAMKVFRHALDMSPHVTLAWVGMARVHVEGGDDEQARRCWMGAVASRSDGAWVDLRKDALEELLDHGRPGQVREALAQALGDLHPVQRTEALIHWVDRLGQDPASVRDVEQAVRSALADPALAPRIEACKAIERLAVERRAPLLRLAADNTNWQVRESAVHVAARIGDAELLMERAAQDEHAQVRKANVRAVAARPSATRLLLRTLADPDPEVRGEAVDALRNRAAEPEVRRALEGSLTDWHVSPRVLSILQAQGWTAARERDEVHAAVARRDAKALKASMGRTSEVLLTDIRYEGYGGLMQGLRQAFGRAPVDAAFRRYRTIENALYAFIGLGASEFIPRLISTLDASEDKVTAEVYLNCGHAELAAAARAWAERRGYTIQSGMGAHPVSWGAL
jgi:tetratricopeptide (TPR) repeat protein